MRAHAALAGNRYAALLEDDSEEAPKVRKRTKRKAAKPDAEPELPKKRPRRAAREAEPGSTAEATQAPESEAPEAKPGPLPTGTEKKLQGGVTIKVLRAAPEGAAIAAKGCELRLIYEGRLPAKNDRRFDNGEIDFLLGDGSMLPGFVIGVTGMAVGERRLIRIPWRLGYGKKGKKPKIPPMSDLDFEASLTFCGVDWKQRESKSDMSNKRREAAKRRGKKPRPA
ncbi:unnamed protein product [Effrenium voratum]|nr:unnamed protein product [Effrenium voratum]